MKLELPELPFAKDALAPHMSADTLDFHHGKHHNAYVVKGNELLKGAGLEAGSLEQLVMDAAKAGGGLFNNVGQHYNHSFFWNSISPNGGGQPTGAVADAINASFGSEGETLKIVQTANADTPLTEGLKPILVCDVWEHAYYLDFQNRRPDFLSSFLDNLVNWEFANQNLA